MNGMIPVGMGLGSHKDKFRTSHSLRSVEIGDNYFPRFFGEHGYLHMTPSTIPL